MSRLREQVKGLNKGNVVSPRDHFLDVSGLGGGIARQVADALGPKGLQLLQKSFVASLAGGIQHDHRGVSGKGLDLWIVKNGFGPGRFKGALVGQIVGLSIVLGLFNGLRFSLHIVSGWVPKRPDHCPPLTLALISIPTHVSKCWAAERQKSPDPQ